MFVKYVLLFFIYSFVGWLYETVLCSVEERKFINRGFLRGPYCPVYGFGAIIDILVLNNIDNIFVLFFAGVILTCSLEYFTSWLLEKLFDARWWDYSYMKFNIKGRICLLGAIVFGLFSVLLIKLLHPFVMSLINKIDYGYLVFSTILITLIFIADLVITVNRLLIFNNKLKELQEFLVSKKLISNVKTAVSIDEGWIVNFKDRIHDLITQFTIHDKRLLKSFPSFKSTLYNEAINKIREYFNKQ